MKISRLLGLVALGLGCLFGLPTKGAYAQQGYLAPSFEVLKPTIPELVSVWDRPRPEYDAVGIRMGAFTVYPALTSVIAYDDNIYATHTGTVGDWIGKIRPEFRVVSSSPSNPFRAYGMVEDVGYLDHTAEDQFNARANFDGAIDVTRDTRIRYFGDWTHGHEDRAVTGLFSSITTVGLLNHPVEFDQLSGGVALDQRFNHTTVSVSGHYGLQNYQNNAIGSTRVDESFRDANIYGVTLRVGQDIGPSSQAYVEGGYERHDYTLSSFSSDSYRLVGGFSGNISRLLTGDVYAGYIQRTYDQGTVPSVDNWTYGGALTWFATPLITAQAFGERTINESTFGTVGSFLQSRVGTRVDYEALRNLIFTGRAGFEWDDYNDTNRSDRVFATGATATYLFNRSANFALDYRFTDRTSNLGGFAYTRDVVSGTLRLQY